MLCILRAMRYLPRGLECGNETSGTTASHRVHGTAGGPGPGAAGGAPRPCGGRPGPGAPHPRSDTPPPRARPPPGHPAAPRCAAATARARATPPGRRVDGRPARPLPSLCLASATARERSGPGARAHSRRRRPRRPPASPAEIAAARADHGPPAFVGLLRRMMPNLPHIQRPLRTRCRSAAMISLLALAATGRAADWEMSLDARLVTSDAGRSFMDGGLGATRYDRNDSGVQLGRARFALTASLGELWSAHLDASAWDDKGRSPVGVTEADLQFRPYPRAGYRFRIKAGAFYPPISLENRAAGWESPYTLSYSAINTWLAVEVRTIGLEGQLDWLGTRTGHDFDLGLTAGAFGWNEGAGVVLASDWLMLHDRPTPVFGRAGQA